MDAETKRPRSENRTVATSMDRWIDESDVLSIFPTLVWKIQWTSDFYERINSRIRESLNGMNPRLAELSAGEAWQSDQQLHKLEEYGEFVACVLSSARTVLKFLKVGYEAVEVTGCWANVSAKEASHGIHTHPNNFLSGVYYVQTWPGADTVNFHDPRSQTNVLRPPVTELTAQNVDQVVVRVRDGTLLMFPSYLPHSVCPSESDELRISVSFNVMFSLFTESLSGPMWGAQRT